MFINDEKRFKLLKNNNVFSVFRKGKVMLKKLINQYLTLIVFIISSFLITISIYVGIPYFMKNYNLKFGEAYLFCFYSPLLLLFIGSLIIYKFEGYVFFFKIFYISI